ncbi:MAG: DUF4105 domain-containing protein, partial [Spirochaetales bacterium]|nr:DUF4105 domain-containing protein [Spirochaetales bacterium]
FCSAFSLRAQGPAPWATGASRGEDLVVKLVTIEPSDPIYTWWGHSALIVEDSRLDHSRFYNYGLFSFEQENFVLDFAMGRLWFQVGASDTRRELEFYRYLDRTIRIQTLDLSPRQRLEMALFLETNILPQNRTYLYEHYSDNCATRVRDLIDATIGGRLAEATSDRGRMSLRQHTRRFTAQNPFMDWLLMFLMSGVIDQPISRWEEMFLPSELERNVADLRYREENGAEKPLVSETIVYYQSRSGRRIPERVPAGWPLALIPGLVSALLALLLACLIRRNRRSRETAWTLLGIQSAVAGLVLGLFGATLLFMIAFTDHAVTYGNENIFLASPLALAAVPLGLMAALGGRRNSGRQKSRRRLQLLWLLLAAVSTVYLVLKIFPFLDQRNAAAAAAILPAVFGFAAAAGITWKSV